MKAMVLQKQNKIENDPLKPLEVDLPEISDEEVLLRVKVCGVCHTDLHIIEGDIPPVKLPLIPGHQVVGVVEKVGSGVAGIQEGMRVGVPWFYSSCGKCKYCKKGQTNLCENAKFTGYHVDGGYAEFMKAHYRSVYQLPEYFDDMHAAPLLCGGVIGYRALKLSEAKPGDNLGLYGFGASAHVVIQIAVHLGMRVFVFSRSEKHRRLAKKLGAVWTGEARESPPERLQSAIIFAPVGWIVNEALKSLDKGGTIAMAGIYSTPIPEIEYNLIYHEKTLRSVANSTREDVIELLKLASESRVETVVQPFRFTEANRALKLVKDSSIDGSCVLVM